MLWRQRVPGTVEMRMDTNKDELRKPTRLTPSQVREINNFGRDVVAALAIANRPGKPPFEQRASSTEKKVP